MGRVRGPFFIGFLVDAAPLVPLQDELPDEVRPTLAEDLHLTLAYLGHVDETAARAAFARAVAHAPAPLNTRTHGLALLGPRTRPWAVSAVLDGEGSAIVAAIGALRDPCREVAGVPPEDRDVLAHVTVGAIPRRADREARGRVAAWVSGWDGPSIELRLKSIALFAHGEGPARYAVVDRHPLDPR